VSEIRLHLPARAASAHEARERVRPLLGSWRDETARDNAILLLSETVTNALRHTHGEILVTVTTTDHRLRAEVHDESAVPPVQRPSDETGGLGLILIDQLSEAWGVDQHEGDGKTVWFEVGASGRPDRSDQSGALWSRGERGR
jgi:two-component sensor histidine kinase